MRSIWPSAFDDKGNQYRKHRRMPTLLSKKNCLLVFQDQIVKIWINGYGPCKILFHLRISCWSRYLPPFPESLAILKMHFLESLWPQSALNIYVICLAGIITWKEWLLFAKWLKTLMADLKKNGTIFHAFLKLEEPSNNPPKKEFMYCHDANH